MAGIAGIAAEGAGEKVKEMLDRISYRGKEGLSVFEKEGTTMGMVWTGSEEETARKHISEGSVGYDNGPGHSIMAKPRDGRFDLRRDELGVAPLYYGKDRNGNFCFASEIKALLPVTDKISEMPQGSFFDGIKTESYFSPEAGVKPGEGPDETAMKLRRHLDDAVTACIKNNDIGSWLSGGLDSSTIAALAAPKVSKLRTFATGLANAPDLEFAREVADHIGSEHHEKLVTVNDLINTLPEVIYHLESFDALLVRSSITNYLVAQMASEYVHEVFSGEGGDELFAGYEYLKSIPAGQLEDELIRITGSLHNTAFQRVDRSASAHGTIAHVVFADPAVIRFAFTIPVKFKMFNKTEKWILRMAMKGLLPERILERPKAKFWEGAGIGDLLSEYARSKITDQDFRTGRKLSDDFVINTREEYYYYRIFEEHFGRGIDLSWMGRTGGSPMEDTN